MLYQEFYVSGMIIGTDLVISNVKNMKTNKLQLMDNALKASLFLLLMVVFSGCSKNDNDNQVINNTHSAIYDIKATDWTGDVDGYSHFINVPELTEDIYYNGAVLVYRLIEVAPKSFNMLPYTYTDNLLTVYVDYDAYVGSINLMYKEVYNGVNDTPAPGKMSFKVVLIEGIPLADLKRMVDVKNYTAVIKMLDINDSSIKTVKF
jgi:hypothetical protein